MAIRNILKMGDETLRKVSKDVVNFDSRLHCLLDDMCDTMRNANGVGLAAPQVGVLRRVFIIETEESGLLECVNPKIIETVGWQTAQESCLSVIERSGDVKRPAIVKIRAYDRNGIQYEKVLKKLAARAISHENDHLDGILFVDKIIETPESENETNEQN